VEHGFVKGDRLEAVDLTEPSLICPATIDKVVGRLIKIRFDGWEEAFDQWMDCYSSDIFPAGWCEANNYNLERIPEVDEASPVKNKMEKKVKSV